MYNLRQKSLYIALLATITRYYNYALFGLSASLLSAKFSPDMEESDQMLIFFLIFSISACARPIGAIIFGSIGDKISRVYTIKLAAFISILSTVFVAILPDFSSIGISALILLTLARMLFMLSLAGEIDTIKVFVVELTGNNKYLAIALVNFCAQIGVILASILYHFSNQIAWPELWRINFILGGILGMVVVYCRGHLKESEEFLLSKQSTKNTEQKLITILKDNKWQFLIALSISGIIGAVYHFLIIFLNSFFSFSAELISKEQASFNNIILLILYCISTLTAGYIYHFFRCKLIIIFAIIFSILAVFLMILYGSEIYFLMHKILVILMPFYTIPSNMLIQSLFPTHIKVRMCAISHSLGSVMISSTMPLFSMVIWNYTESMATMISYFAILLISLLLFFLLIPFLENDKS